MSKQKSFYLCFCLVLICCFLTSVSAVDFNEDLSSVSDDMDNDLISVDSDDSSITNSNDVKSDSIGSTQEINENNTNSVNNALKSTSSSTSVSASSWDSLKTYCANTDSNYVITLSGTEYNANSQITFGNNATIIGTGSSYVTCSNSSLIPFNNTGSYSITLINMTFKDSICNILLQLGSNDKNTIENCTFNNITVGTGKNSVIYNTQGWMNIVGCNFTNCSAGFGAITNYGTDVNMNVTDCKFINNSAGTEPGAINNCGFLNVTNSDFINNHAAWWAGAIHTHINSHTYIDGSRFINNSAGWNGGALYTYDKLEVYNSIFEDNNCTTNNGGGAIGGFPYYGSTYNITIKNCTFKTNKNLNSGGYGGAIAVANKGNLDVSNSTFISNSATTGQAISVTKVYYENATGGKPYVQIYNNTFINHTSNTNDTVYLNATGYVFENNTFDNCYQTQYNNSNNTYSNVPSTTSSSNTLNNRILRTNLLKSSQDDKLSDSEGTVYINQNFTGYITTGYANETYINCTFTDFYLDFGWKLYHEVKEIGSGSDYPDDVYYGKFINCTFDRQVNYTKTLIYGLRGSPTLDYNYDAISIYPHQVAEFENCIFKNINATNAIIYYQSDENNVSLKNCVFINCSSPNIIESSLDVDDCINITNCWYGSNEINEPTNVTRIISTSWENTGVYDKEEEDWIYDWLNTTASNPTYITTGPYAIANLTNSTPVVYDGSETVFKIRFLSKDGNGNVSEFDTTGYPPVNATYSIDDQTNEVTLVDGVYEFRTVLKNNTSVITATVGSEVLVFRFISDLVITEVDAKDKKVIAILTDDEGNPISGVNVTYAVDGNVSEDVLVTDENGSVVISDLSGEFVLDVNFAGVGTSGEGSYYPSNASLQIDFSKDIETVFEAEDIEVVFDEENDSATVEFNATLKDTDGNVLADKQVQVEFNGEVSNLTTDENGVVSLNLTVTEDSSKTITLLFAGDDDYNLAYDFVSVNITPYTPSPAVNTTIATEDISVAGANLTAKLTDADGNPVANKTLEFLVSGEILKATTDDSGVAVVSADLTEGTNDTAIVIFNGDDEYEFSYDVISVDIPEKVSINTTVIADNITVAGANLTATLKDADGNPLANKTLHFVIDNNTYEAITDVSGVATVDANITAGTNKTGIAIFAGDEDYNLDIALFNINVAKKTVKLIFSDMTTNVVLSGNRNGENFTVQLTDEAGNPLANKTLKIGFNGKVYNKTTDENGTARLQINIGYQSANTFSITFLGDDEYEGTVDCAIIVVKTLTTKMTASKSTYKSTAKTKKLTATLKYGSTALQGKKVTFKVNGQYYIATTNSKGVATVKVTLSTKKTYSYTATFDGDNQYSKVTATNKVVIK